MKPSTNTSAHLHTYCHHHPHLVTVTYLTANGMCAKGNPESKCHQKSMQMSLQKCSHKVCATAPDGLPPKFWQPTANITNNRVWWTSDLVFSDNQPALQQHKMLPEQLGKAKCNFQLGGGGEAGKKRTKKQMQFYLIDIRQAAAPRIAGNAAPRLAGRDVSHLRVRIVCKMHLGKISWKL